MAKLYCKKGTGMKGLWIVVEERGCATSRLARVHYGAISVTKQMENVAFSPVFSHKSSRNVRSFQKFSSRWISLTATCC
jgi:hypothetical protein